jgi:hypothetical protein
MATLGTFSAGQVLTAAELNAIGTFTSFTPSWTNINGGTGASNTGQYCILNKIMYLRTKYVLGTGGSLTGTPTLTLPASASLATSPTMLWIPSLMGAAIDSGVQSYSIVSLQASTTTIQPYVQTASGTYLTNTTPVSGTVPFTFGVNDYIELYGWVQIA